MGKLLPIRHLFTNKETAAMQETRLHKLAQKLLYVAVPSAIMSAALAAYRWMLFLL